MRREHLVNLAKVAWCAAVVMPATVVTQDTGNQHEYSKLIKSAEAVGVLGPDLFGDQTNFYTGTTSFSA